MHNFILGPTPIGVIGVKLSGHPIQGVGVHFERFEFSIGWLDYGRSLIIHAISETLKTVPIWWVGSGYLASAENSPPVMAHSRWSPCGPLTE